ncbi:MAG: pyrroline-5-carboxylate reductase [Rikenellaceae bacterium]|jgi:pyrroline-5-carboxylate reductase|nr:pyrroline-5-carboxylate reductase [Rikenellaceae bacterium]
MKSLKIAVIGAGNMGGALVEGFLNSGRYAPESITIGDLSADVRRKFEEQGVKAAADNAAAVSGADVVIVGVKPWLVERVAGQIKGNLTPSAAVVSIAGGVGLDALTGCFGGSTSLYRAIPNIAASLGESMTFVSREGGSASLDEMVVGLFESVGQVMLIDEKQLDAAMVAASCGIAYALRYVRASMEAGIEMGLGAAASRRIVAQTIKGAAELLLNGDQHPEAAIDQVTTPGGTTIVGLNEMERSGFTGAVIDGYLAAFRRVKGK